MLALTASYAAAGLGLDRVFACEWQFRFVKNERIERLEKKIKTIGSKDSISTASASEENARREREETPTD